MSTTPNDADRPKRAGITFFGPPAEAPLLHETEVMSMPEMDPPALDQMIAWGTSGGNLAKVLFQDGGESGMSLVWSWFGPTTPRPGTRTTPTASTTWSRARPGWATVWCPPAPASSCRPGAPYAYTAGPENIEILEFRNVSQFDMQITEGLCDRWG